MICVYPLLKLCVIVAVFLAVYYCCTICIDILQFSHVNKGGTENHSFWVDKGHFIIMDPYQWVYTYQFCSQTLVLRAASASYRMSPAQSTLSCLCWPSGQDVVFHMDIQWWPPSVLVTIVNSNDDSDASRDFHPQIQWSLPNVCSLQMGLKWIRWSLF